MVVWAVRIWVAPVGSRISAFGVPLVPSVRLSAQMSLFPLKKVTSVSNRKFIDHIPPVDLPSVSISHSF